MTSNGVVTTSSHFLLFSLLLLFLSVLSSHCSPYESAEDAPESAFSDEFVIEVPGGASVAKRVAKEHGLVYEGAVHEHLGDFYVVRRRDDEEDEKKRKKRRTRRSAKNHLEMLKRDERLSYVERQLLLERVKRGYLPHHLLVDDDDNEGVGEKRNVIEVGKMRNKWVEFERENEEFERRHPAPEKEEDEEEEEKRGVDDDDDDCKVCKTYNDPMWKDQWYICNKGQTGGKCNFDLNIQPAWNSNVTGHGVVVTIMDDGLDHRHPDLKRNFDMKASWDANGKRKVKRSTSDPVPRLDDSSNNHGTKCAGEIAMERNNRVCGVGIAPDCKVGGIRILDGPITDRLEAQAILYQNQHIDIFSASWGPKDNGETMEAPGKMTSKALEKASTIGRGGLGNVFVWASGNGGSRGDDCGADGYVGSIYTTSIGSINEKGESTYFMERCPSTMAVVFSGGMHDRSRGGRYYKGHRRVKTISTDINGGCVENFQGTSAAAPLATGCVALLLSANPKLGWRDVQHIIVNSARIPNPEETSGWEINGAGLHINDKFGFGALDCSKMVQLGTNWTNVPKQRKCVTPSETPNVTIPKLGKATATLTTDACRGDPENRVDKLEHVRVAVGIKHPERGDLIIRVYSPDGTSSELLSRREKDRKKDIAFVFMTVRSWGENPAGKWTLEVVNEGDEQGVLEEFYLELYGYQTTMDKKHVEGIAETPNKAQVDAIFKEELEQTERIQLKRVARVLERFSEADRTTVLSAMTPVRRKFVESKLFVRDEDDEDVGKREMNPEEEIETMQHLVDMIDRI